MDVGVQNICFIGLVNLPRCRGSPASLPNRICRAKPPGRVNSVNFAMVAGKFGANVSTEPPQWKLCDLTILMGSVTPTTLSMVTAQGCHCNLPRVLSCRARFPPQVFLRLFLNISDLKTLSCYIINGVLELICYWLSEPLTITSKDSGSKGQSVRMSQQVAFTFSAPFACENWYAEFPPSSYVPHDK
eukprot:3135123-Amphidinium_carterae.1